MQLASRALFKRRYRLSVLACIGMAEENAVYAHEVAVRLTLADNQIAPDFQALRDIGALKLIDTPDRESWHQRVDHPVWSFAQGLLLVLAESHAPGRGDSLLSQYGVEVLGLNARLEGARM